MLEESWSPILAKITLAGATQTLLTVGPIASSKRRYGTRHRRAGKRPGSRDPDRAEGKALGSPRQANFKGCERYGRRAIDRSNWAVIDPWLTGIDSASDLRDSRQTQLLNG